MVGYWCDWTVVGTKTVVEASSTVRVLSYLQAENAGFNSKKFEISEQERRLCIVRDYDSVKL